MSYHFRRFTKIGINNWL